MPSETPSPAAEDQELVRSFLDRRSEESFLRLYRRHSPRLFQLCLRLAAWVEDEAEEVLQETWLVAAQRLDSFRWQSSLPTWLTGIMINVHRDHRRRQRRREREVATDDRSEGEMDPRVDPDPVVGLDLDRVIARLPAGYREVLVLHDIHGYTHMEIAEMLSIGVGTSKSQLFGARRAMRRQLQSGNEEAAG